jgi:hypothetical protein
MQMKDTHKQSVYASSNTELKKMTKTEYLEHLKNVVFKNNKNLRVGFDDIKIYQHPKSKLKSFYGVRLVQTWKGDSYNDKGYLFFVIEFRENANPLIWVRVWQDIETDSQGQIGLGDFKIE